MKIAGFANPAIFSAIFKNSVDYRKSSGITVFSTSGIKKSGIMHNSGQVVLENQRVLRIGMAEHSAGTWVVM